eukprot:COSAG06_NODE_8533_length_2137_cov_1.939647_1_plen_374_part_10
MNISRCVQCPAGQADLDSDSTTACIDCAVGQHAAGGGVLCQACEEGEIDLDSDASTPCTVIVGDVLQASMTLPIDISTIEEGTPARVTFETQFINDLSVDLGVEPAQVIITGITGGSVVVDFEILPGADATSVGPAALESLFSSGSLEIAGTSASGLSEIYVEAAGASDPNRCLQYCSVGTQDEDCDQSTPCTGCDAGEYSPGGMSIRQDDGTIVTRCVACDPGKHAPEGSQVADCVECDAGSADLDLNSWTPCAACGEGAIPALIDPTTMGLAYGEFGYLPRPPTSPTTNATKCHECEPGRYYGEMPNGGLTCYDCFAGKFNPNTGSLNSGDCTQCSAGTWSINGSAQCSPCQVGNYRPEDVDRCQPCNDESW